MGGSDIEYEINCSYGNIPRPLSENASEIMTLSSVSIFRSTLESDSSFSSSFCEFSSTVENDLSSLSFDMFGSGNLPEMVGSFGFVTEGHQSQIAKIKCPFSYVPNLDAGGSTEDERISLSLKNDAKAPLDRANEKRRKLALSSNFSIPNKNAEDKLNVEPIEIVSETLNKEDKTMIVEHRVCANFITKSDGKQQAEGGSQSVQAPKENYIHVRARRGRATNSHSLAERVRREKISERMKLLQELVPGCNQITGKTVVLDEIINYVQSLQQQVEFLSMKLANVSPESNLDTEQILLKNNSYISSSKILRTRGEGVDSVLAINPRLTVTSHTTHHAMFPTQQLSSLYKMKR